MHRPLARRRAGPARCSGGVRRPAVGSDAQRGTSPASDRGSGRRRGPARWWSPGRGRRSTGARRGSTPISSRCPAAPAGIGDCTATKDSATTGTSRIDRDREADAGRDARDRGRPRPRCRPGCSTVSGSSAPPSRRVRIVALVGTDAGLAMTIVWVRPADDRRVRRTPSAATSSGAPSESARPLRPSVPSSVWDCSATTRPRRA